MKVIHGLGILSLVHYYHPYCISRSISVGVMAEMV